MNEFDLAAKCCNVAEVYIGKDDYLRVENTFGDAVYIPIEDLITYLKAEGRIELPVRARGGGYPFTERY